MRLVRAILHKSPYQNPAKAAARAALGYRYAKKARLSVSAPFLIQLKRMVFGAICGNKMIIFNVFWHLMHKIVLCSKLKNPVLNFFCALR